MTPGSILRTYCADRVRECAHRFRVFAHSNAGRSGGVDVLDDRAVRHVACRILPSSVALQPDRVV
jgi:hypothetical protein